MLLTHGCALWGGCVQLPLHHGEGPHHLASFQDELAQLRRAEGGVVCAGRSFMIGECFR
ncbi:MAG: hypothetical protein UDG94_08540 [Peptococcaceae bacterium]|nr:hypothetical protein [Peptococcaceae bacterium]